MDTKILKEEVSHLMGKTLRWKVGFYRSEGYLYEDEVKELVNDIVELVVNVEEDSMKRR